MKRSILVALVLAFGASSAFAQSYAGISLGKHGSQQWRDDAGTVLKPDNRDRPVTVYGGYKFTDMLALEAGFARLSDADYATTGGETSARSGALYVAARASFAFNDRFGWYLKGGVARNYLVIETPGGREEKDHSFRPMGAVGIDYRFTPRVAAVAEFAAYGKVRTANAHMRHNVAQLGVRFDF